MQGVVALPIVEGVRVKTPNTRPTQLLAARLRKKAPWPQSCWMMNSRTIKPAGRTASSKVSQ
jgi:hypothetical protein